MLSITVDMHMKSRISFSCRTAIEWHTVYPLVGQE